jgi:hypothetical protein
MTCGNVPSLPVFSKRWFRKEGYSGIAEADLLELIRKIEAASR